MSKALQLAKHRLMIEGIVAEPGKEIELCVSMCFSGDSAAFQEWALRFVNGSCPACED